LYCQNIFILILKPNFGDLSLKYPFIIILLEYAIEKSHNATPLILSDMVFLLTRVAFICRWCHVLLASEWFFSNSLRI